MSSARRWLFRDHTIRRFRGALGCACALLLATCDLGKLTTGATASVELDFALTGDSLLPLGGVSQLSALPPAGTSLEGVAFDWSSSNPAVATVTPTGEVAGVSVGSAILTATARAAEIPDGVSEDLAVRVRYASVGITPFADSLTALGSTRTLTVTGRNTANQSVATLAPAALQFLSRDTSIATVSSSGVVTARRDGSTRIVAVYDATSASPLRDSVVERIVQVPTALAFTTQPGLAATGSPISPAVQVSILDSRGNVVTNSSLTVTLSLASNPGSATLGGTPAVVAQAGVATFDNVTVSAAGTGYTLRASVVGGPQVTSASFNVITVGPPAKLAFTVNPTTRTAGTAFSPSLQVAVQDAAGVTVPSATNPITLAVDNNPGGGSLSGTTTVAASGGTATFTSISLNRSGTGYTLRASSLGLTDGISASFNISAGAASKLDFITQPSTTTINATMTPAVQVAVQDAFGNTVTTATNPISLAITTNPAAGVLSGTTTNVAAVAGVATFGNLSINVPGEGYVITASATGLTSAPSNPFTIAPAGPATRVRISTQPSNISAGTSFAPAIAVTLQDSAGNTANTSSASVTLAIGTGPAGTALTGVLTRATVNGVATFTGVSATKAGPTRIVATAAGLTSDTSATFTVSASPAARLAFVAQPPNGVRNTALSPGPQVAVQDTLGNTVTSSSATVSLALQANPGGAALSGGVVNASSGVATFGALSVSAAASGYTLLATSGSLAAATSASFDVAPFGPATKLAFAAQPSNTGYGIAINPGIRVEVQDAVGNVVTNAAETVALSLSTNPSAATLSGGNARATTAGAAQFDTVHLDRPGTGYVITAAVTTGSGVTSAVSQAFNVTATGTIAAASAGINGVTLDGETMFYTETGAFSGAVRRVAATGGASTALATGLSQPVAVVSDGVNAYWIETADGGTGQGRIARVPVAGGAVTTVVGGLTITNGGRWLAVDGGTLYFLAGGAIKKASASAVNGSATDVVASGVSEFVVSGPDIVYSTGAPSIARVPLAGGSPTTITTDFDILAETKRSLVVAAGRVYFYAWKGGQQCIRSAPVGGGMLTSHTCFEANEHFASDGASLYGITTGSQLIRYPLDFSGSTNLGSSIRSGPVIVDSQHLYYLSGTFFNPSASIIKRPK